jgi:hypothetical protein
MGGSGHLAMIVTRGIALSELMEKGCSVSCFEPGSVIWLSPWSWAFFVLCYSHLQCNVGS